MKLSRFSFLGFSSLGLASMLVLGGCSVVDASGFDRTCDSADDCMPAYDGSVCNCTCASTAINQSQAEAHDNAVITARLTCGPVEYDCALCEARPIECRAGTCEMQPPAPDG